MSIPLRMFERILLKAIIYVEIFATGTKCEKQCKIYPKGANRLLTPVVNGRAINVIASYILL